MRDQAGNVQAVDATLDFFVLTADANHDRTVDTIDFNILATNFALSDKTFGQGDFDYSGTVDTIDFNLLASSFATTLAPATSGQAAAVAHAALPPRSQSPTREFALPDQLFSVFSEIEDVKA